MYVGDAPCRPNALLLPIASTPAGARFRAAPDATSPQPGVWYGGGQGAIRADVGKRHCVDAISAREQRRTLKGTLSSMGHRDLKASSSGIIGGVCLLTKYKRTRRYTAVRENRENYRICTVYCSRGGTRMIKTMTYRTGAGACSRAVSLARLRPPVSLTGSLPPRLVSFSHTHRQRARYGSTSHVSHPQRPPSACSCAPLIIGVTSVRNLIHDVGRRGRDARPVRQWACRSPLLDARRPEGGRADGPAAPRRAAPPRPWSAPRPTWLFTPAACANVLARRSSELCSSCPSSTAARLLLLRLAESNLGEVIGAATVVLPSAAAEPAIARAGAHHPEGARAPPGDGEPSPRRRRRRW